MKKLLMALAFLPLMAAAETWFDPSTGYAWTYSINDGKAIIGYEDHWSSAEPTISPSPEGDVIIPSAVNGVEVKGLEWLRLLIIRR